MTERPKEEKCDRIEGRNRQFSNTNGLQTSVCKEIEDQQGNRRHEQYYKSSRLNTIEHSIPQK